MNRHQVYLQPAYVLHQRPYRDSSALVDLFTPEHGRLTVVAKGVRAAKSKWRGLIQPFQPLLASWISRGDLGTLTGAESRGAALMLSTGEMIASGFYINEILMRLLTRHDSHPVLFADYDRTLLAMSALAQDDMRHDAQHDKQHEADAASALEILLRKFELTLLTELGYGLVLDHEVASGHAIQDDTSYCYYPERGPVAVAVTGATSSDVQIVSGHTLLALQRGELPDAGSRQEAKRLLRAVLGHHLGPNPLLSRQLLYPLDQGRPLQSSS